MKINVRKLGKFKLDLTKKINLIFLVITLIFALAIGALFLRAIDNKDKISCSEVTKNIDYLVTQRDYKAIQKLINSNKNCDLKSQKEKLSENTKSEQKINEIISDAKVALQTYKSGDVQKARTQAKDVLAKSQSYSETDQLRARPEKIQEYNDYLADMYLMQSDDFNPNRPKKAVDNVDR